jgi:tRNA-specific 2-thiouridylase
MKSSKRNRVVFGIDEGLPSRVAASILRNQDFDLLALHLHCDLAKLGEDPATYPSAMSASNLPVIEKFCESLGVPLKCIDVTEEVLANVYTPFWIATLNGQRFPGSASYARNILFPHLDSVAVARGADALATGHFAKRAPELYQYPEVAFDQSRTLARLDPKIIAKLNLPVGEVSVEMLMRLAREIGATEKEGGPFTVERETATLTTLRAGRGVWEWTDAQLANLRVQDRAAGDFFKSGPLAGAEQFAVGEHRGIPFFHVGSRAPGHPGYYVKEIVPQSRTLIVADETTMKLDTLFVHDVLWSDGRKGGVHRSRRVSVEKERPNHRQSAIGPQRVGASLLEYPGQLGELTLEHPLFGISPSDVVVFFEESRVLGSALVAEVRKLGHSEMAIEKLASPT